MSRVRLSRWQSKANLPHWRPVSSSGYKASTSQVGSINIITSISASQHLICTHPSSPLDCTFQSCQHPSASNTNHSPSPFFISTSLPTRSQHQLYTRCQNTKVDMCSWEVEEFACGCEGKPKRVRYSCRIYTRWAEGKCEYDGTITTRILSSRVCADHAIFSQYTNMYNS